MELTENQRRALKLIAKGKSCREIARTGIPRSTVHCAIKTGKERIDKSIETIEMALRENILTPDQISRLKRVLRSH